MRTVGVNIVFNIWNLDLRLGTLGNLDESNFLMVLFFCIPNSCQDIDSFLFELVWLWSWRKSATRNDKPTLIATSAIPNPWTSSRRSLFWLPKSCEEIIVEEAFEVLLSTRTLYPITLVLLPWVKTKLLVTTQAQHSVSFLIAHPIPDSFIVVSMHVHS